MTVSLRHVSNISRRIRSTSRAPIPVLVATPRGGRGSRRRRLRVDVRSTIWTKKLECRGQCRAADPLESQSVTILRSTLSARTRSPCIRARFALQVGMPTLRSRAMAQCFFSIQLSGIRGTRTRPRNFCGADRDRTDDLRLAKPALSRLSYSPRRRTVVYDPRPAVVGQGRVELPTSRLSGVRSNHLSYWPFDQAGLELDPWKLIRT